MEPKIKKNAHVSNKRKREPVRSVSQFSISQPPLPKKIKNKKQNIVKKSSISIQDRIYRVASYLKRLPRQLIQTLRRQMGRPLKTKSERKFIYARLQLLDQQYALNLHRSLWQSYFDLGFEHGQWPVSILFSLDLD